MPLPLKNGFEAGPSGQLITAANSAGVAGVNDGFDITNSPPAVYDSAFKLHDAQSIRFSTGATSGSTVLVWREKLCENNGWVPLPVVVIQIHLYLTAYPPAGRVAQWVNGTVSGTTVTQGSQSADLNITATGHIQLRDLGSANPITSPNPIPLNQWVRIEARVECNTVGHAELRMYHDPNSSTPTSVTTTTTPRDYRGPVVRVAMGYLTAQANVSNIWFDSFAVSNAWIGSQTATPVVPGATYLNVAGASKPSNVKRRPPIPDASTKITYAPPLIQTPTNITVTNAAHTHLLNPALDYNIVGGEEIDRQVEISRGRFVYVHNLHINQVTDRAIYNPDGSIDHYGGNRGLWLKGNPYSDSAPSYTAAESYFEGIRIGGPALREGVNVDGQWDYGRIWRFNNMIIGDHPNGLVGTPAHHHADAFQLFNGVGKVEWDRISILTNYQGFMIQPSNPVQPWVYRRLEIVAGTVDGGASLVYQGSGAVQNTIDRFYVTPNPGKSFPGGVLDENENDWAGVVNGPMPEMYKPNGNPGLSYVSPGYEIMR